MGRLVIDGNSVYEIDEECLRRRENHEKRQEETSQVYGLEEKIKYENKHA